jgi:hypothetical protein
MRGLAYQQAESIFRQPPPHMSVCLEFPFERPATPYGARTPTVQCAAGSEDPFVA